MPTVGVGSKGVLCRLPPFYSNLSPIQEKRIVAAFVDPDLGIQEAVSVPVCLVQLRLVAIAIGECARVLTNRNASNVEGVKYSSNEIKSEEFLDQINVICRVINY